MVDCDPECFDEVWYEFNKGEKNHLSWHQIKPFMHRLLDYKIEYDEMIRLEAEEREARLEEYNQRVAEKLARKEALERAQREAEEQALAQMNE